MSRPIILSNGELHVGLNNFGMVHDFYYPYVGHENHAAAKSLRHRIGVWVDGECSWLDDGNWEFCHDYPHQSLIGYIKARNPSLGILIEFDDAVDSEQAAFLRNIHVVNERDYTRDVRLYLHQVFAISDAEGYGDTVQYLPDSDAIVHYKGHRTFLISGIHAGSTKVFDQYSVGLFGIENHEGTFRDAEDGELSKNAVEHGRVDSVIGFCIKIDGHDSKRVHYWIAAGKTLREAHVIDERIRSEGLVHRLMLTQAWWRQWITPAKNFSQKLPKDRADKVIKSALLLKAHTDKRGAIMASTDTTMLNYWRDAYTYCWPRDAAYVIWPLLRLGYTDEPLKFFHFAKRALGTNGYLMHKYQADGALGSSWHPYVHGDMSCPPLQEDETALVLFVFGQYYQAHADEKLLKEFYPTFVEPMANFLAGFIDEHTGLPKPSYDLWEEVFLTTTYTTATVYAALLVAVEMADAINDNDGAVRWRTAADSIREAAHRQLFNERRQCFYKGILRHPDGTIETDERIDSASVFGAYMYGLFDLDSAELVSSVASLKSALFLSDDALGVPRYENDQYNRVSPDIIGNPWFISTLWLSQYERESGSSEKADVLLKWVEDHMLPSGVLSEQIDPRNDKFVSVAPLAWSQAEYISTVLDTVLQPPEKK